jgi:hypothetical protein
MDSLSTTSVPVLLRLVPACTKRSTRELAAKPRPAARIFFADPLPIGADLAVHHISDPGELKTPRGQTAAPSQRIKPPRSASGFRFYFSQGRRPASDFILLGVPPALRLSAPATPRSRKTRQLWGEAGLDAGLAGAGGRLRLARCRDIKSSATIWFLGSRPSRSGGDRAATRPLN